MRSRRWFVPAAVTVLAAGAVLIGAAGGRGQGASGPAVAQPVLGVADYQMTLMGYASSAATPEVWGYRDLPIAAGVPSVDGQPLEYGSSSNARTPQLVFERWTRDAGWRIVQTPLDDQGRAYRGFQDNELSARITPAGAGLLVGNDPARSGDHSLVVLGRDPGGRFRILPEPAVGPGPTQPLRTGEALGGGRGTGEVTDAAVDEGGKLGAFFGVFGPKDQRAVLHWDGSAWSREQVNVPGFTAGDDFTILRISATSTGNAWLLAQMTQSTGRGVALFRRVVSGGVATWEDVGNFGGSPFANRTTAASGVSGLQALSGSAESLTATAEGVWIDGSFKLAGSGGAASTDQDFTIFYNASSNAITGSWCDAPASFCGHRLGARFSRRDGYRSFAWAGAGRGTRIVTNPLEPGGAPETNRGTYLRFENDAFERRSGGGGNLRRGGAFASVDEGWLDGPVHVTQEPEPAGRMRGWPLSLRSPLTSVAPEPGKAPGSLDASALAVGSDGAVARFKPGSGWSSEFLLTSSGAVARSTLRGVAWPEPSRAHAVGDLGAMWMWRSDTGLWERDPGAPIGFEGNLLDVAFDPANPDRGYAVGQNGVLLRYDKSWVQDDLPAGYTDADFSSIAFAGSQAIVVASSDLLVNDGAGWHVDDGARALLDTIRPDLPRLYTVAALPDGGAVAAGRGVVIERDAAGAPWHFADQPLPGATVVAAGAFREGARVRAVVSVAPGINYPPEEPLAPNDPNIPPPIPPAFTLPPDGYVLRETGSGWRDEQHAAFRGSGTDRPLKTDPILDFDLGADGQGWSVGGWSGEPDSAGRGSSGRNTQGRSDRARVQTGGIYRYGDNPPGPGSIVRSNPSLTGSMARFAVAGHAQCEGPCADMANQSIAPDRNLGVALGQARDLASQPGGPRFLAYTGGRLPAAGSGDTQREETRYADVLGSAGGLPVYSALSAGDTAGGSSQSFRNAFAGFASPFGGGAAPAGTTPAGASSTAAGSGARTHYAFDSAGDGGTIRVIVIDNSRGSLAASDPYQNPAEPQQPWLVAQLGDAKARSVPAVVIGSRDLNSRFRPALNVATDADLVAKLLLDGGASAYFFERPEENRAYAIPSGSNDTLPSFGTGTLGYRSPLSAVTTTDQPDSLFGDQGFLLAEVDVARRDATTNRAPVTVKLVPTLEDLSLQAVDGTLLRRSRVALFQGLGRRPIAGDRWGDVNTSDGNSDPPGGSPYTSFPPDLCLIAGCDTRIAPEYEFSSSSPDFGDFVKQDPNSRNPRKLVLGENGKPVADNKSGLFCAYNAGTTQVTVRAGGLAYTAPVTVLRGTAQRPCGTVPLSVDHLPPRTPPVSSPPPPPAAAQPQPSPPLDLVPPVPPVVPLPTPAPVPPPKQAKTPPPVALPPTPPPFPASAPPPPQPSGGFRTPGNPPPQTPGGARPIPPGGAVARVFQVEEKKEEELATEESQAFTAYHVDDHEGSIEPWLVALVLIAALAGAAIRLPPSGQGRRRITAAPAEAAHHDPYRRKHR